jgi:4-amino-4-deoxy-L-arabinose transferase-like glycosyltransferase
MQQDQAGQVSQQKTFSGFFSEHFSIIVFAIVICFVIIFSVSTLVTKPRFWTDEAVSIHIARSFLTHGILSPQITPDSFLEPAYLIQSTGYPVTVSLAGFFKIFGYGLYQARVFMILWIIIALSAVFFLAKKLFGETQACFSLLLIASFASFYGSGRTVVGEIPGFAFLLAGFYFLLEKSDLHSSLLAERNLSSAPCPDFRQAGEVSWSLSSIIQNWKARYFLVGLFWGLAVVTKPSVFGLIIPTIVLTFIFERKDFFKKNFYLGVGMIPAAILAIALVVPKPFNSATWESLGNFYNNPFSSSIPANIAHNLAGFFHSTTLIYFGLFFVLVLGARFIFKDAKIATLYTFTLFYSLLAFVYYLRSPGWLRYILIAELLILFILPNVITILVDYFKGRFKRMPVYSGLIVRGILVFLVVIQFVQMFTIAKIFLGDDDLRAAAYIRQNFPDKSIGVLGSLEVAALLPSSKVYLTFFNAGLPIMGVNPLLAEPLPDVVISDPNNRFANEGRKIIDSRYVSSATVGGYSIYVRK